MTTHRGYYYIYNVKYSYSYAGINTFATKMLHVHIESCQLPGPDILRTVRFFKFPAFR